MCSPAVSGTLGIKSHRVAGTLDLYPALAGTVNTHPAVTQGLSCPVPWEGALGLKCAVNGVSEMRRILTERLLATPVLMAWVVFR